VAETILLDPQARGRLLRYAGSRFGISAADAEDLIQETALGLLRQRGYVRNPDAFFFCSFRASCARHLAARQRVFERIRPASEEEVADATACEQIERQVALREALGGISTICRRLLAAYYVEGLTLTEAANGFTLTYAGVSQRINRCLKRLRACLN
jgi:RNA polymerase sigma factor (sigma-70 family)